MVYCPRIAKTLSKFKKYQVFIFCIKRNKKKEILSYSSFGGVNRHRFWGGSGVFLFKKPFKIKNLTLKILNYNGSSHCSIFSPVHKSTMIVYRERWYGFIRVKYETCKFHTVSSHKQSLFELFELLGEGVFRRTSSIRGDCC
jgi:hypothetical protein